MTKMIYDVTDAQKKDEWTTSRLKDEFFLCLTNADNKKYYKQAENLIYRIPLTEHFPKTREETIPFVIYISDLSETVKAQFEKYCKLCSRREMTLFLKDVLIPLFENIDYEYTHMSVMKKLRAVLKP